jgi:hypothetical protein
MVFDSTNGGEAVKKKSNRGRKKNAVKSAAIAGLPIQEKFQAVRYGEQADATALAAIHALHNALHLKSSPPHSTVDKQIFDEHRDLFWEYVASNYQAAWTKHDGTFFRKLADAMEVHQKPNDAAWTCVTGEILICQERGLPIPTVSEMHLDLSNRGITATRKTVENIYKFHGIERTDKRGPKPGTKQKSVHRANR